MLYNVSQSEIKKAKQEYELYRTGNSGSFTTSLLNAFHKADSQNFAKLSNAFPQYAYIIAKEFRPEHLKLFRVLEE